MYEHRASIASLIIGLLLGTVLGLWIASQVPIQSDQLWSLVGSAVGAFIAIAGGIWLYHYEAQQREKAERRRLAGLIDGALALAKRFHVFADMEAPRYTDMQPLMREMAEEYRIAMEAIFKGRHTSAEIARAAKHLGTHPADQVATIADSNKLGQPGAAKRTVEELEKSLRRARGELRV